MEVQVSHLGEVKFEAATRGHRVISDQPPSNGGADSGMTPPELLLASLGTCAGFYAVKYLQARSLPMEGLNLRVTAEKAEHPARMAHFQIEVTALGLKPEQQTGVLRAVKSCLIHNTLLHAPAIEVVLSARVEEPTPALHT